jgi:hypothetical protein
MSDSDEMNALALAYLHGKESLPQKIREAFGNMPQAPLAKIIEECIAVQPRIDLAPLLKRIALTNQGRVEDLSNPEFKSYLIAECDTTELDLHRAISIINNFLVIKASAAKGDKTMLIAARDGENSGQKSATMNDLLKQIGKRKK